MGFGKADRNYLLRGGRRNTENQENGRKRPSNERLLKRGNEIK